MRQSQYWALTQFWCSTGHVAPISRACSKSSLARPYIWRFTSLSLVIWPSVCPLDQDVVIAALTAALSLDAVGERHDEACACPFQPWFKLYGSLLADHRMESGYDLSSSTRRGTPCSIAAMVTVSDLDSVSRPLVIRRAIVLADGTRCRL